MTLTIDLLGDDGNNSCPLPKSSDFTVLIEVGDSQPIRLQKSIHEWLKQFSGFTREASARQPAGDELPLPSCDFETEVLLNLMTPDGVRNGIPARAVFVSCNNRQSISATFRLLDDQAEPVSNWPTPIPIWGIPGDLKHFVTAPHVARTLHRLVVGEHAHPPHGLVVFSGATKCAKSDTTRNWVLETLRRRVTGKAGSKAPPHLVTVEDPIEKKWRVEQTPYPPFQTALTPANASRFGLWLTPRACGQRGDTPSLGAAVKNSLRQTPAAFYIGEIRNDDDWKEALFLAGTGHLVVTTTHAGSLAETWYRLLNATQAKTDAERAYLARRVLSIVHLVMPMVKLSTHETPVLLPALWRQTGESIAAFASDGISSTLPNGGFSLARSQVVDALEEDLFQQQLTNKLRLPLPFDPTWHGVPENWKILRKEALRWDRKDC